MRDYLLGHPGAAERGPRRCRYTDPFRRFVSDLRSRYEDMELQDFAQAVGVPVGTLYDWLHRNPADTGDESPRPPSPPAPGAIPPQSARMQRIQAILRAWENWEGGFIRFCKHVEEHLRIPYKRTLISSILEKHGVRKPRRRPGRSPDEVALRKQFEIFFPGAQWSADGTPMTVEVAGNPFTYNLELVVDPASGAFLGCSIRKQEDAKALTDAFRDAVETAGEPPIALLVDNRPSNHTEDVDEALDETLRVPATPYRPQNKAHSEGGFGLLSQTAPPLVVPSLRPADVARAFLAAVVITWARTLNHKPRRDRAGRSRAQLYDAADPSPEEIEDARRALEELVRKQELARRTLEARQNPVVRDVLDNAFDRLGLIDPERSIRLAIARYSLDHVLAGIAVFEGKRSAGTLPDDVDGRYLLGIVRNLAQQDEGLHIAQALWKARLAARDSILLALDRQRELETRDSNDPRDLVRRLSDRVIDSTRQLDRDFWLDALAQAINAQPQGKRHALFTLAARRIHVTFSIAHKDRLAAVRRLAAMLLPSA